MIISGASIKLIYRRKRGLMCCGKDFMEKLGFVKALKKRFRGCFKKPDYKSNFLEIR